MYTPPGARAELSPEGQFIVALFAFNENRLQLRVLPGWEEKVASVDRQYIAELLKDFMLRAAVDPDELFEQALSLTVGPLTVREYDA